ncbi:hypothetical protein GGD62_006171 [Bradyrhizobium sp. ERR14]|nr:hypothetical protein [Bradyrhizobium sp. ERR14]
MFDPRKITAVVALSTSELHVDAETPSDAD